MSSTDDDATTGDEGDVVDQPNSFAVQVRHLITTFLKEKPIQTEPSEIPSDPEFRQKYERMILPLVRRWPSEPAAPNFVHEIVESQSELKINGIPRFFMRKHKIFFLEIAISNDFQQLAQPLLSNDDTMLHHVIRKDPRQRSGNQNALSGEPDDVPWILLFCDMIQKGIESRSLSLEDAAEIVSKTNKREETCLHLALIEDLPNVCRLIDLVDETALKKKRDNGNTPLHDALAFSKRFVVPTPRCKTPTLRMEMSLEASQHQDASSQVDEKPPNCCNEPALGLKMSAEMSQSEVISSQLSNDLPPCNTCLKWEKDYRATKTQRSHIICKLIKKCPEGLAFINKAGKSPFSEHVMGREEYRQRKGYGKTGAGGGQQKSAGNNFILRNKTAQSNEMSTLQKPDCSTASKDRYHFSMEVEKLLWEQAFQIKDYEQARLCLVPKIDGVKAKETLDPEFDKDSSKSPEELRDSSSRALKSVFSWLTGPKNVKRILKLVVEDNENFPCSERDVRECLDKLEDVRYLDWKRPNMSAPTLLKAPNVVELWLYSTGINAVLSSWADKGGLQRLQKGIETIKSNQDNVEEFKKRLQDWYSKPGRGVAPQVFEKYPSTVPARNNGTQNHNDVTAKASNDWFGTLDRIVKKLRQEASSRTRTGNEEDDSDDEEDTTHYIKVALLDDGVDPESGSGKFMSGWGWPRPSEPAGAFYSSGERRHGNAMAKMITRACPFVRLYVAKLDAAETSEEPSHPTFEVAQATEAILWAIEMKVEVISMSWNVMLGENSVEKRGLQDAILAAQREGILMFCAASEKKPTETDDKSWPCGFAETISIGAASERRNAQDYVGDDANFILPLDADGAGSGSSAATALSAGLASLILYSFKKARYDKDNKQSEKLPKRPGNSSSAEEEVPHILMRNVLDSLCKRKDSKYVDINMLGSSVTFAGIANQYQQLDTTTSDIITFG
ncbi:intracellular serine protease [Colletotrichum chrysophilum]|uniref:Intracellular serine protease n=1 Tax=Colletotrichum chrysophilum TaxID=1836956 RepID=A0AAD9EG03_9PEZI|nr:intracellular serine protease [Colletotrichum chrysophilum]